MRTRQETLDFLSSLTGRRVGRFDLQHEIQQFFNSKNSLVDEEEYDEPNQDWTMYFSTGTLWEDEQIEFLIAYAFTRDNDIVILYTELLEYCC